MNKQVGRIREIYKRYEAVCIWLGKESKLAYRAARATAEDKPPLYNWSSGCSKSNLEDNVSD
jgi:hypothetical protein